MTPVIIEAILFAEQIYPGKGRGKTKLALIRETLEDVYALDENKDGLPDMKKLWAFLERRIQRLVNRFNKDGWPELTVDE